MLLTKVVEALTCLKVKATRSIHQVLVFTVRLGLKSNPSVSLKIHL